MLPLHNSISVISLSYLKPKAPWATGKHPLTTAFYHFPGSRELYIKVKCFLHEHQSAPLGLRHNLDNAAPGCWFPLLPSDSRFNTCRRWGGGCNILSWVIRKSLNTNTGLKVNQSINFSCIKIFLLLMYCVV